MARKKKSVSPFKKGKVDIKSGSGSGKFINIQPDSSVILAPMVGLNEMISADMHQYWDLNPPVYHPCIGENCPGEILGNEARFKGFLPVIVKGETEPSIYSFTISVYNQLEELEETLEDGETLAGMAIKIKRNGSGLKTRYLVIGTGRRISIDVPVPEITPSLGAVTEEGIWEVLESTGEIDRNDYLSAPSKPAETSDDDSDDDDWGDV